VRIFMRARKPASAADRLVGDSAILRSVGRELNAVEREREGGGWTADLAARALAALRIVATYAVGKRAARSVASRKSQGARLPSQAADRQSQSAAGHLAAAANGGQLVIKVGWPRSRRIAVSGAATAQALMKAIASETNGHRPGELESIQEALARFTVAQYGRPADGSRGGTFDDVALDESLRNGQQVLRRLKLEQTWIMRRLGRSRKAAPVETRVWSR